MTHNTTEPCPTCKGTGKINKKVWTQGPHIEGVHPAILARRPAYRTIASFTCPDCKTAGTR